ncbi:hypothetical protein A3C09_00160 [Candidatus Uhrbacteria bacterium RIFCSPHIGHO2_02_FULL_47_44]|uniref:Uncharacterized protein n=1 Tax=Candidatus Uhrbacteria bacterium RIFCSPLOWO2_02_FULL_48_18 TaxID=1802408 RepID=A0A1F7VE39_9BACT|nr:MAG: hypothetical protein A3C09_00160 [Candidatus Uhrbacteria bacterium RIFCSPHIGHO2_02_FULL_47_44]OGL80573.1 MAG: hypothetical protein A3B20_04200 [Candidatus Uhrbacteria bacterium RIFCSPLOWO2_01_FULL_47_17]OGL88244.1 MAG: hypothetical protein A3I41_00780 [Candidatus Uhrbacteria bacterium RIFCSPLOWO2_02_FULL_48_18]OGL93631.1 MAG: hypothetical protein A3H12_03790 [Candidatus Uhrbacteria bacterium RIFCSPLOWO2_12_FULL_47_9]
MEDTSHILGGNPNLLTANRNDDGRWLNTYNDNPDNRWNRENGFAFLVPQFCWESFKNTTGHPFNGGLSTASLMIV